MNRVQAPGALCALISLGIVNVACDGTSKAAAPWTDGKDQDKEATLASTATASATSTTLLPKASHAGNGGTGTRAKGEEDSMDSVAARPPAPPATGGLAQPFVTMHALGPGNGTWTASDVPNASAPLMPRLDPNARYATTYRPGGAALAAFDAAVARGAIPAVYRDLVGDFGARYAPAMQKPTGEAMTFQVDTGRAAVAPSGGPLDLRIAMVSSADMPARAKLSVHLVLDVSGSMSGTAIDNARKAAETLVEKLEPTDDFSMTTFSDEAQVLVPDGVIGPRRAQVLSKIRQVHADGGTNISAGLDLGYAQVHAQSVPADAVKIVMFLSDGHANAGETNAQALAERAAHAFQDGIQTSSFGLGSDFDAPLMSTIADRGAGGYYYLADSSQIAPALGRELDARLVPVAQAVEVRVRLRPDVAPTKVFGSRELTSTEAWAVRQQEIQVDQQAAKKDHIKQDRQNDAEGGMRFFMPAFSRDDRHAMLLTLAVPAGVGERSIGSVEIRYKDRLAKKNVTREIPVKVTYASSDAASAATTNASVVRTSQAFAAGDAILAAAERVDMGDRVGAARMLSERADVLKQASDTLHEPMFAEDGQRLARLATAVSGSSQVADALPLAVMLRGSAYGYLR
jgi:Ca-activated chloride channel family protein